VKIDTSPEKAGIVLAEYRTSPQRHVRGGCDVGSTAPDPSRTAVDLDGSVWVADRADNDDPGSPTIGSDAEIGLVVGGRRGKQKRVPAPLGEYLAPGAARLVESSTWQLSCALSGEGA